MTATVHDLQCVPDACCCCLQVPLVVVTSWPDAVVDALETSLQSIKDGSYNVVLGSELVQPGEQLTREENALVGLLLPVLHPLSVVAHPVLA